MIRARSKVPEDVWLDVLGRYEKKELDIRHAREEIKNRTGHDVSPQVFYNARHRYASVVASTPAAYRTAPAEGIPDYILHDLASLDKAIHEYKMYIEDLKKTLPPLSADIDNTAFSRMLYGREHIGKCFERMVKAIDVKVHMLQQHRIAIKNLTINKNMTKAEMESIGAEYYKQGMEDAKKEFKELCAQCKGVAAPIVKAQFVEVKDAEKASSETTDTGTDNAIDGDTGEVPQRLT